MRERRTLRRNQRGAILIQTAISILMLMGFTVFVCDYGVVLVSRGQAQNSADAGALAGAISMAFDVPDPGDLGQLDSIAKPVAIATARQNLVWNQPGGVTVQFPLCSPGDVAGYCIQVNVYRNGLNGSAALPAFFGPLLGIDWQGAGAAARAEAWIGNATSCLRSFALPDKFVGWGDDLFNAGDIYTRPDEDNPGTGYTVPDDHGTELVLKQVPEGQNQVGRGWVRLLDMSQGGSDDREMTRACGVRVFGLNDVLTNRLNPGADLPSVRAAVEDLIALDPGAFWDPVQRRVRNSCAATNSCNQYDRSGEAIVPDPSAASSPRVIVLPIVHPRRLAEDAVVRIVNFVGFFIIETRDGPLGDEFRGVMLTKAGLMHTDVDVINKHSSFLKTVRLVR